MKVLTNEFSMKTAFKILESLHFPPFFLRSPSKPSLSKSAATIGGNILKDTIPSFSPTVLPAKNGLPGSSCTIHRLVLTEQPIATGLKHGKNLYLMFSFLFLHLSLKTVSVDSIRVWIPNNWTGGSLENVFCLLCLSVFLWASYKWWNLERIRRLGSLVIGREMQGFHLPLATINTTTEKCSKNKYLKKWWIWIAN